MNQWEAVLVVAVAIITLLLTITGLLVRYMLLPYLRESLIKPVSEINNQVTVNGGTSKNPTVLDRLEQVRSEVRAAREEAREAIVRAREEARAEVRETRAEVIAIAHMFDGHLEWSQDEVDRLAKEIRDARKFTERAVREHKHVADD